MNQTALKNPEYTFEGDLAMIVKKTVLILLIIKPALLFFAPQTKAQTTEEQSPFSATEKSYFLTNRGLIHPHIIRTTGLARLAKRYYNGNMPLAYDRGQAILKAAGHNPNLLAWFRVDMDSYTFFKKQNQLYDPNGALKEIYRYSKGQELYANKWHKGNMDSAYVEGLVLLKIPKIFMPSFWTDFLPGKVSKDILPPAYGSLYSYHQIAMFRHLGWTTFPITHSLKQWTEKRELFIDPNGQIKPEWQWTTGQIRYAKRYTKGNLRKAWQIQFYLFENDSDLNWTPARESSLQSTVQIQDQMFGNSKALNWHLSKWTAEQAEQKLNSFLDSDGRLKAQYISDTGYELYAIEWTNGHLGEAFKLSLLLPSSMRHQLHWYEYDGSIEDRKRDRKWIQNNEGMPGLLELARLYYEGHLRKAYQNVLSFFKGDKKALYEKTGYLPFDGPFESGGKNIIPFYEKDKETLIRQNGTLHPHYKGMDGYVRFANEHYKGDMHKAFENVKAVLEGRFSKMEWTLFPGSTTEFKAIKQHINTDKVAPSLTETARALTESFIKKNTLTFYYQEDIKRKIQAVLNIKPVGFCEQRAFF